MSIIRSHLLKLLYACTYILVMFACAEREKDNPFDPSGTTPLRLSLLSNGRVVELSWGHPDLTDFIGFNIYRKNESEATEFKLIASLASGTRNYSDRNVEFQKRYSYYIVVKGNGQESKPSNIVSIIPGPGNNWVVDRWGFQVLKLTYDAEHIILGYYTNYPPTDMAIAKSYNIGFIIYTNVGLIDIIDLDGRLIETIDQIPYPYAVAYDSTSSSFWLVDSSGSLFRINASDRNVQLISGSLKNPTDITIAKRKGTISVLDNGDKKIVQFNRNGDFINEILYINDQRLSNPKKYLIDDTYNRIWLADGTVRGDLIYSKKEELQEFLCLDTLSNICDLALDKFTQAAWICNLIGINSSVVQLSANGMRQLEISNLYEPNDIAINPYDGTLIIVESGRGRLLHYNSSYDLIGAYTILNFPVKVVIE